MTTPDEEAAWRLIVDHYDETAERETPLPPPEEKAFDAGTRDEDASDDEVPGRGLPGPGTASDRSDDRGGQESSGEVAEGRPQPDEGPTAFPAGAFPAQSPGPFLGTPGESYDDPVDLDGPDDEDGFVPPDPPKGAPLPTGHRVAWAAVVGAPSIFLLAAFTGQSLTGFWAALLVVALVAGFGYLVLHLPKEPRDPWDDGSRI